MQNCAYCSCHDTKKQVLYENQYVAENETGIQPGSTVEEGVQCQTALHISSMFSE